MNIKLGLIILLTLPFLTAAQDQSASLDGAILSDTGGYDMSKYVTAALQRVRNNWYAVMPEAARKGEKGKVTVVFTVGRDGKVQELRVVESSGVDPLDKGALSAVQLSNPFAALPSDFKQDRIVLRIPFLYNMQQR